MRCWVGCCVCAPTTAEKGDMSRAGNQKFMGKLRGNMFGSEYLIFDEGENVKRTKKEKKQAEAEGRGELGMVIFPKELIARGGAYFRGLASSLRSESEKIATQS